jgi:hypothetical protein
MAAIIHDKQRMFLPMINRKFGKMCEHLKLSIVVAFDELLLNVKAVVLSENLLKMFYLYPVSASLSQVSLLCSVPHPARRNLRIVCRSSRKKEGAPMRNRG